MIAKASLRSVRVSPQKARLVADLVRGEDVEQALDILTFSSKKSAHLISKLIRSALSNAENQNSEVDLDTLFIKTITVDGGPTLKRFRPRAMGRATPVIKRTSHITLVLDKREE